MSIHPIILCSNVIYSDNHTALSDTLTEKWEEYIRIMEQDKFSSYKTETEADVHE